jgi:hypothetical protein
MSVVWRTIAEWVWMFCYTGFITTLFFSPSPIFFLFSVHTGKNILFYYYEEWPQIIKEVFYFTTYTLQASHAKLVFRRDIHIVFFRRFSRKNLVSPSPAVRWDASTGTSGTSGVGAPSFHQRVRGAAF